MVPTTPIFPTEEQYKNKRGPPPALAYLKFIALMCEIQKRNLNHEYPCYKQLYKICLRRRFFKKDELKYESFEKFIRKRLKRHQLGAFRMSRHVEQKKTLTAEEMTSRLHFCQDFLKIINDPGTVVIFGDSAKSIMSDEEGRGKVSLCACTRLSPEASLLIGPAFAV